MIHPTALVHPTAQLAESCSVGPYVIIDAHVTLGPGCLVGPHVHLTGHTTIGARNRFHTGCVIGDAPQDLKYSGQPTRLVVGDDNLFREHVTLHRSNRLDEDTVIGNGNLFMAGSHVGHNCQLGHQNVIANGALLAGHVVVADRVFISGNCLVHQFCRIGRLAMMQGGSGASKDLPPFCISRDLNRLCGLNIVGLRRAGFSNPDRLALKQAYNRLFHSHDRLAVAVAAVQAEFASNAAVQELAAFVATSRRGVCTSVGRRRAHLAEE
jgi:UDP-N-acetylglucosamine acyltransferase